MVCCESRSSGNRATPTRSVHPLALAWWLALRDLFLPICGRGFLLSGVVLLLLGLALGVIVYFQADAEAQRWRREEKRALLPNRLWDEEVSAKQRITPERLRDLDQAIRAALAREGAGDVFVGCVPFDEKDFELKCAVVDGEGGTRKKLGRTAAPDDPIWAHLEVRWLKPPKGTAKGPGSAEGVVITESTLKELGFSPKQPPDELYVYPTRDTVPRRVVLLGTIPDMYFPPRAGFAMTEGVWKQLLSEDHDVTLAVMNSRPLADFPEAADLPVKVQQELGRMFRTYGLKWPPQIANKGQTRCWKLEHVNRVGEPHSWRVWLVLLRSLQSVLVEAKIKGAEQFADVKTPDAVRKEQARRGHDRVGVWLKDPAYFRLAAPAAREVDLALDETPINDLENLNLEVAQLERQAQRTVWLIAVGYLVGLLLVYAFRVFPQARHLALLQAVGVSRGTLVVFYLWQGVVLWSAGTEVGAVGGTIVLRATLGPAGLDRFCHDCWPALLVGAGCSLLITMLGPLLWAIPVIWRSPMWLLSRA